MTSTPASRNARATTLAPRSWPSRPGFAITTRIFLIYSSSAAPAIAAYPQSSRPARPQRCVDRPGASPPAAWPAGPGAGPGGGLIVAGAGQHVGHDRGRTGEWLGRQLGLDRPQFPGVLTVRHVRPR